MGAPAPGLSGPRAGRPAGRNAHRRGRSRSSDTDQADVGTELQSIPGRRGGARTVALGASRYHVLLAFGASYSVGAQMASVSVVLPFLLAQKGIFWAAGLLYPTFSIGFIAGNALSPLVVERSRRRQNVVIAAAAATIAALTSCIAVAGTARCACRPGIPRGVVGDRLRDGLGEQCLRRNHLANAGQRTTQPPAAQPGSGRCGVDRRRDSVDPSAAVRPQPGRGAHRRAVVGCRRNGGGVRGRDDRRADDVGHVEATHTDHRRLPRGRCRGADAELVPVVPGHPDRVRADRSEHDVLLATGRDGARRQGGQLARHS